MSLPNEVKRYDTSYFRISMFIFYGAYISFILTLFSLLFIDNVKDYFAISKQIPFPFAILVFTIWSIIVGKRLVNYEREVKRVALSTPEQLKDEKEAKRLAKIERDKREFEFNKLWYAKYIHAAVRYIFAILCIVIVYFIQGIPTYLALIFLLLAASLAYEITAIGIAILLAYYIFEIVVRLPISVAVILGALIIAAAIKHSK